MKKRKQTRGNQGGFSVADLTATLAVVFLLGMLAPVVTGHNSGSSKSLRCISNHHQLARAWLLYAEDNNGQLVGNYHGGEAVAGAAGLDPKKSPWTTGWLTWGPERDNTNSLLISDRKFSRLAPYYGGNFSLVKCPEDNLLSPMQKSLGWTNRVRSVSMNATLGVGNAQTGPWDSQMYRVAYNLSDVKLPSPAETFVFIDEHPDSINDPLFFPPNQNLVDVPSGLHHGGSGVSFADGRAAIKKWRGPSARLPVRFNFTLASRGDEQDISWLSYHSQRISSRTY